MYQLQQVGVPAGVVANGEDLYHDVHLRARGYLTATDSPETGRLEHPGLTIRFSRSPGAGSSPAPALGEANEYVFRELVGLSDQEYRSLVESGAIG
jgi:crotonobetainyl-CoA:carnitine CoA-transferase CaiB-like acyl-CoA transferase